MNSKCGVQSKRKCESHQTCVCIVGFSAYGCHQKSVVYEMECRHAAVQRGKQDLEKWMIYRVVSYDIGEMCSVQDEGRLIDWFSKTKEYWSKKTKED